MIEMLKTHLPQCFDKDGKLIATRLKESINELIKELELNAQTTDATQIHADNAAKSTSGSQIHAQNTAQNSAQETAAQIHAEQNSTAQSTAQKAAANAAKSALSKESYALTWLGSSYAKLMQRLPANTLITQDFAHNAQPQNAHSKNVLIKGDNLEVLKHLKNAYYRKVKAIYIDPPYNTGSGDFIYKDERDFTPQSLAELAGIEEGEAKRILEKTLNKSSTHSAWLSFMHPRLHLAKALLRDDGVIFISIDDNEQANLKLLCDSVFGEGNFVANLHIELSATQGMKVAAAQKGQIVKNAEYILVYAKSVENLSFTRPLYTAKEWDDHYSVYINPQTKKRETLMDFLKPLYKDISKKKIVNMYQNDDNFRDFIHKNAKDIYQDAMIDLNFDLTQNDKEVLDSGKILKYKEYLIFKTSTGVIRQLLPLEKAIGETDDFEAKFGLRKIRGDWWSGFYKDMMNINKEGGVIFKNGKKPVRLIKDLLTISTTANSGGNERERERERNSAA